MSDKITLSEKITAINKNIRELWDLMDDDQQKGLINEFYILNRYISSAPRESSNIQEHFLLNVNKLYNKHWNVLQKHPKLLWLSLCMCNYNKKNVYHEWIGYKKKPNNNSKKIQFLLDLYPTKKEKDIEILANKLSNKEFIELAKEMGLSDQEIKKLK